MGAEASEAADGRSEAEAARRAAILGAAGFVFTEKGFEAATTLEIARRARVSKRDLYRLFDSKEGLLDALIATHTEEMVFDPTMEAPADRSDLREILRRFGRRFLAAYLDPRRIALYRMAISAAPRSTRLSRALHDNGYETVRASAVLFITKAVERGLVAVEDAELTMASYFDVLVGPLQLDLLLGIRTTPSEADIAARADRAVEVATRLSGGRGR